MKSTKGKGVKIKIIPIGPGGSVHNLTCWICNKEPAVYDMHPNWIFRPCWMCQGRGVGNGKIMHNKLLLLISKLFFNP